MSARFFATFRLLTLVFAVPVLAASTMPAAAMAASQSMHLASERLLAKALATSDVQEARFLFERAIVADPANANALSALGSLYSRMGKPALARKYYGNALLVDPTNAMALAGAAHLDIADGKTDKARERLTILKVVCPACRETRNLETELSTSSSSHP